VDFHNTTPFNADLLRTAFGEDHLLAALIARPTFRIEGRELVATPEAPWPVDAAPMETPAGPLPGDLPLLSGGIDVFVVGSAHAPGGGTATALEVDVRVGDSLSRRLQVTGNRRWERRGDALVASEPEPFSSMPLSWENAYGGKAEIPEGEMTCLANPLGKGFYLSEEQADGAPLPNLEDPQHRVEKWNDQPDPFGTAPYPENGSLRPLNAVDFDAENLETPKLERISPLFFNRAHPRMIIEPSQAPKPGDEVVVSHVHPDGDLRFAWPELPLHAHVQLEQRSYLFPLHVDQIGILAEDRRVFLSCRVVFRYRLVPMERRRTTLHAGPLPADVPADYVQAWAD
jgi:hypothetical protein